jgi:D-amino peptidase
MKKKYMIRCDMEGASGVVSMDQAEPSKSDYNIGKKYFMSDLLAVINGLNECESADIYIYDEHFHGRNVELSELPKDVFVYCGKPQYTSNWAGGLDSTFAGMIMVGLHSKAGTKDALLNHTYEEDISDIKINNISVGEIGLEAAIAGELDVPLILVTADSEGVREAKELVPDVIGVSVKESFGVNSALCITPNVAGEFIREAVKRAIKNSADIKPFKIGKPVELIVSLTNGQFCKNMRRKFATVNERNQVVIKKETLLEAYAFYWDMKLACQTK